MDADDLATGLPYDYSALAPPGSIIFTAGACPLDATGAVVAPGDVCAQAERAVANLLAVLARHGAHASDLVRTTIYVVGPREDLVAAWGVISSRLAPSRPPSTLLGVACLGYEHQLVEIDGIATLPTDTPGGTA